MIKQTAFSRGLLLLCVLFVGCDESASVNYVTSPNHDFTVQVKTYPGAAMSSSTTYIAVAPNTGGETGTFQRVFKGRAGPSPQVQWIRPDTILIKYCGGYVYELNAPYWDSNENQEIYIQVVNTPDIELNGSVTCPS